MAQEDRARRNVQEADDEVDHRMMPPTPQQRSVPNGNGGTRKQLQWS